MRHGIHLALLLTLIGCGGGVVAPLPPLTWHPTINTYRRLADMPTFDVAWDAVTTEDDGDSLPGGITVTYEVERQTRQDGVESAWQNISSTQGLSITDIRDDRIADWSIRHRVRAGATGYRNSSQGTSPWAEVAAVIPPGVAQAPTVTIDSVVSVEAGEDLTLNAVISGGLYDELYYSWEIVTDPPWGSLVSPTDGASVVFRAGNPVMAESVTVRCIVNVIGQGINAENNSLDEAEDTEEFTVLAVVVILPVPATPSAPTLFSPTNTSLALQVEAVAGAAGYRWRYSIDATINDFDPMVSSTGTEVTITGLDADTDYWIDVRAENSAGESDYSGDLATSTLLDAPNVPATPTLVGRTDTTITVEVVSVPLATSYSWRISIDSTVDILDTENLTIPNRTTFRDLEPNTDYWIYVASRNADADSDYSAALATSTTEFAPVFTPDVPTGLAVEFVNSTTIDISWNAVSDVTHYNLEEWEEQSGMSMFL